MEVQRIMGQGKPQIHHDVEVVSGEMAMPLAINANEHITPIPEGRPKMDLLPLNKIGCRRGAYKIGGAI
jgi:hypothetical protein